jgi:hypothetical protein
MNKRVINLDVITNSLYDLRALRNNEGEKIWSDRHLTSIWYGLVSEDLAKTFKAQEGLKLIINGDEISHWDAAARMALTLADFVAIRDTRPTPEAKGEVLVSYIPQWSFYNKEMVPEPKYPILLKSFENGYLASDGMEVEGKGYAAASLYLPKIFEDEIYKWLFSEGMKFQKSGRVIFAPFIPDLPVELEFLRNGVSTSKQLDADSLWSTKIDFLNSDNILALSNLDIPKLNRISVEDMFRVKEDYHDEFLLFSRSILKGITMMKSASNNEGFIRECRSIQRDLIDDHVDKITTRFKHIQAMRWAGVAGLTLGVAGLTFSSVSGANLPSLVTGMASSAAGGIAVAAAQYKERFGLKENPMHFLWRLRK